MPGILGCLRVKLDQCAPPLAASQRVAPRRGSPEPPIGHFFGGVVSALATELHVGPFESYESNRLTGLAPPGSSLVAVDPSVPDLMSGRFRWAYHRTGSHMRSLGFGLILVGVIGALIAQISHIPSDPSVEQRVVNAVVLGAGAALVAAAVVYLLAAVCAPREQRNALRSIVNRMETEALALTRRFNDERAVARSAASETEAARDDAVAAAEQMARERDLVRGERDQFRGERDNVRGQLDNVRSERDSAVRERDKALAGDPRVVALKQLLGRGRGLAGQLTNVNPGYHLTAEPLAASREWYTEVVGALGEWPEQRDVFTLPVAQTWLGGAPDTTALEWRMAMENLTSSLAEIIKGLD
jgi:hypothetical protein